MYYFEQGHLKIDSEIKHIKCIFYKASASSAQLGVLGIVSDLVTPVLC